MWFSLLTKVVVVNISGSLLIAWVLKGFLSEYKPFTIIITQKCLTFSEFTVEVRCFKMIEIIVQEKMV